MNTEGEFRRIDGPDGVVLWVDPVFEAEARALGLLDRDGIRRAVARADGPRGRGATSVLPMSIGGRLHLRPLRHGGWFGSCWRGRVVALSRPLAELTTTAELRRRGAPVPRPALVSGRRAGWFWRAAVGTVYEENCVDGLQFLAGDSERRQRVAVARCAGAAVRRFHDLGGQHRDLHAGNLLVRHPHSDAAEVLVVDLDKARVQEPLDPRQRAAEITRLLRSVLKHGFSERLDQRGRAAFLAGYAGRDRALRRELGRHLRRQRRWIGIHAIGYSRS